MFFGHVSAAVVQTVLRKEGDSGAVERLLCVCYLLFCIVRSGYYGKLFLTREETSNANAAGDSGHLAHHLNRLERLFFCPHCVPGCAVWFTEM